ncbi:MAG: putative nucleotidyltransferase component of viral defense system [Candidatus Omnitrophota bacterium]|jgi:predicted nucleotidyltransferase component of viral defense system
MKEHLLKLVRDTHVENDKLNIMREYLQAYALRALQDQGGFKYYAFIGGTALRFLYDLPRFSEDLDFYQVNQPDISFVDTLKYIKQEFVLAGYDLEVKHRDKVVQTASFKFKGLLYETGLSPLKEQVFSIKMDVDTNPPEGAVLETKIVNKFFPISFLSFDLASLLAGKMHALLYRKYTKGRDYYDLSWYLSRYKDLSPNIELLKNALIQTHWEGEIPQSDNWRDFLSRVVEAADWDKIVKDVSPFLENQSDMNVLTKENVLSIVRG